MIYNKIEAWKKKATKKEVVMLQDAQKRAQVRTTSLERDYNDLYAHIKRMGVTLKSLEGCRVIIAQAVSRDFPASYKYRPEGTVTKYLFKGGRPVLEYAYRDGAYTHEQEWLLTDEAKKSLIENWSVLN